MGGRESWGRCWKGRLILGILIDERLMNNDIVALGWLERALRQVCSLRYVFRCFWLLVFFFTAPFVV